MKSVIELVGLLFLGAVLAVPFAVLIREAGGVHNFIALVMIGTATLGGTVIGMSCRTKTKKGRIGAALTGALLGLMLSVGMAKALESDRQEQCKEADGAFGRAFLECDSPMGG
ncbi:hypothetical protein EWD90_22175 [Salmonella enterica subsp. enterica serovar Virchow]|nr:hypothetical protein [Salmonella enterica subsp. enterica serovar Virchow]